MADAHATERFDRPSGEPVSLLESSDAWRARAQAWTTAICAALARIKPRVEHIGSTAIPGLLAKPVLDLLVSVTDLDDKTAFIQRVITAAAGSQRSSGETRAGRP